MLSPSPSDADLPLKVEGSAARFSSLLRDQGTSLEAPAPAATWRAFVALCREQVECDERRLFFEADLSNTQADAFYLYFARTCYGREPKGHLWSHEVICDFVFALDEGLEEFSCTVETEEFGDDAAQLQRFCDEVQAQDALWKALQTRTPQQAQIYIGES